MNYFICKIFLLLLFFIAEFPIANGNELVCDNEHLFLEFVKDPHNFEQLCKDKGFGDENGENIAYYETKYVANLGVVFLLKKNWHCANIGKEFQKNEAEKCKKYRKYLDVLYEYLFCIYAGVPTVKPMFYYGQIYAVATVTETVKSLAILSMFYFNSEFGKSNDHKLKTLFVRNYEPKLFNEDKLNYEENLEKETFQETVVKMGQELKLDNEIGKSHLNAIRIKFDKNLWAMLKKAGIRRHYDRPSPAKYVVNFNKLNILILHNSFQQKDHTYDNVETNLPILYLMRRSWHCAKSADKENEDEQELRLKCEKYRNYLQLVYKYVFILSATEQRMLAHQMPAIRPMFEDEKNKNLSTNETVKILEKISMVIFGREKAKGKTELLKKELKLNLPNEKAFRNYVSTFGNWNKTLRQEFDKKSKTMLKNAREREKLNQNWGLSGSPFYDEVKMKEDQALVAYLKGQTDFENFCEKNKEFLLIEYNRASMYKDKLSKSATFDQQKEHLELKYEAHLGAVYLMREKWDCAKIGEEFEEQEKEECKKHRKYLDILYQYLFNVYAEEDDDPAKAINSLLLIRKVEKFGTLIVVVRRFNDISKFYFNSKFLQTEKYQLENSKKSRNFLQNFEKIFKSEKKSEEKREEKLKKFDEKMKKIFQKAEQNGMEEEAKIKTMEEEIEVADEKLNKRFQKKPKRTEEETEVSDEKMEEKERTNALMEELRMENARHNDKFGTLFDSPFYGTISI